MLPLTGVKVVEIAVNYAGPFAGEILGSLGAEIVKIERPDGGDDARGWGPPFAADGASVGFHAVNRTKRSLTLDLKDAADLARLKGMIAEADVLVQNMRPGSLDAMGLGAEAMRAANPRLVYCSLWAFGAKGPMRLAPGYEPMVQAFSGLFSLNGTADGPPTRVGMQVLDLGTGVWAALGCIAGLFRRGVSGQGCTVDASLLETSLGWMSVHFANFAATGVMPTRDRTGNPRVVVFGALPTADRELVVAAANDRLFAKFARELGHPEWAEDPRYRTNADRVAHKDELLGRIADLMRERPSDEWLARLGKIGVPAAPINDLHHLRDDPQVAALGILQEDQGLTTVGLPLSFDGERPRGRK